MRIPSGVVHVTSGQAIVDEDDYKLYIPSSVRSIGEEAFSRVYDLEEVTFERGSRLERIEDSAFSMCFDLKKLKIPASCEYIGQAAFDSCKLSELGFENDSRLKKIDAMAFWNSKLESMELPESLVEIGEDAFANCEALEVVRLREGLEKIADSAFENCQKLYSINIPGTVTYIGRKAFAGCSDLRAMDLPDSVITTGERFLDGCSGLRSITIPRHARSLESFPLFSCQRVMGFPPIAANERLPEETVKPMLTHILVSGDNESYCSVDGVLYTKDMTALLKYPFGRKDESFSIPEGVREIGGEAFALCTHLKQVIIPDSVSSIGYDAFRELPGRMNERCQGPRMTLVASEGSWAERLARAGLVRFKKAQKTNTLNSDETCLHMNECLLKEVLSMEGKAYDGTGAIIIGIDEIISIVTGKDPAIRTIGILSPENPDGIDSSAEENAKAREDFIRKATALFPKVGHLESHCPGESGTIVYNSYIIPGISKGDLIRLAAEFRQETAVFGEFREEGQPGKPEVGEYRGSRFELILTDEYREGAVMVTRDVLLTEPINDNNWYWKAGSDKFSIPFFRSDYKTEEERRHYPIIFSNAEDNKGEEEEELDLPFEFETDDSEDYSNNLGDFFIDKDILSAEMIMHYEKYDKRQGDKNLTEMSRIINNRYITFMVKAMRKERGHKYFVEEDPAEETFDESEFDVIES